MRDNSLPGNGAEAREAIRVNLFMAATPHTAGVAHPVKIRNLSESGAQIESSLLPEVGSAMTLSRGHLSVEGHITWCTERRCGLHFSSLVSVPAWMSNPVNREQQRVDHIVTAVKAGAVPLVAPAARGAGMTGGVAEDLARVSKLLESLGDALASDPALVTQHGIALQNLDIAMQTLTALAATMAAGAPAGAARSARLDELRTSCAEALQAGS